MRGAGPVLEMAGRVGLDRPPVLLHGVGEPADEGRDERDDADGQQPAAEDEAEEQQEHAERTEERPERRSGHVDAGRRPVVDDGRAGSSAVGPMSWS